MKYQDWLAEFRKDKKLVSSTAPTSELAVHSLQRFLDRQNRVWEIAFTYTDRLVVRSGTILPDGVSIRWGDWTTEHHVILPS